MERRLLIGGMLGASVATAFPFFLDESSELAIRPPGSIGTMHFNTLCVRCGSCIKVCPTQILKHETRFGLGLLTPVIQFKDGYCIEDCNMCSVVCPSGSIAHYRLEIKKDVKIGTVEVNLDNCLLMNQKECAICKNACPYNAIKFVDFDDRSLKMKPKINDITCNGCGACAIICPENCIKIQAI